MKSKQRKNTERGIPEIRAAEGAPGSELSDTKDKHGWGTREDVH